MKKNIAIYSADTNKAALYSEALTRAFQQIDQSVEILSEGFADINIFIAPFEAALPSQSLAQNPLAFQIYIGAQPDADGLFDYKFLSPLRLGRVIDRIVALLEGRAMGQLPRRLKIKGAEICLPENDLRFNDGGEEQELTDTEVQILCYLYVAAQQPISRQDLLDNVWGYHKDVETHTLETHIYRLRQKLERDPAAPEILVTAADGYVLKLT